MRVQQITKIGLAWELCEAGVSKMRVASNLDVNRDTIRLWVKGVSSHPLGLVGFLDDYKNAKKGSRAKRKIDGLLKKRIWRIREENRECCGQKIQLYLWNEFGVHLSVETIYKVLREKYKLRSKWKKNQKRGHVPKAKKPREVVQMDTVHFGYVYAFTAVDIFSKDVSVQLYPSLTSSDGLNFLTHSMKNRYKYTDILQTDGGPEFKGEFRRNVLKYSDRFRIARPYKKNEQSYIESFNRSLRKECLGWTKYKQQQIPKLQEEVNQYLDYYHTKRAHIGLNLKTPNDILRKYQLPDF